MAGKETVSSRELQLEAQEPTVKAYYSQFSANFSRFVKLSHSGKNHEAALADLHQNINDGVLARLTGMAKAVNLKPYVLRARLETHFIDITVPTIDRDLKVKAGTKPETMNIPSNATRDKILDAAMDFFGFPPPEHKKK